MSDRTITTYDRITQLEAERDLKMDEINEARDNGDDTYEMLFLDELADIERELADLKRNWPAPENTNPRVTG